MHNKTCEYCSKSFESREKRKRFCNQTCAAIFNNRNRTGLSDDQKQKISIALKKHYKEHPRQIDSEKQSKFIGQFTAGKYNSEPKSLLEFSKRTVTKVMKRLKIGCSYCGWNEDVCDIHHINGRKISDPHNHSNLTYLCPNCHRLAGKGKIKKEQLTNLVNFIGDRWKEMYYG